MNRNTAIVLAVIVVGALILGAIYIPPLLEDKPPMTTSVEFYDKDGNVVGSSVAMAIYAGGAEVETMTVKAEWIVDTTDIDPASFNAHVRVDLAVLCLLDTYEELDSASIDNSHAISADDPDANWEGYVEVHTWVLADLLSEYMTDAHKAAGWTLRIKATLTPTATDVAGNPVVPDPPTQDAPTILAELTWVTTTASMTIVSFETKRWLPLVP